jgi:hypothetical protein
MGTWKQRKVMDKKHIWIGDWYFLEHVESVMTRRIAKKNEHPIPQKHYAFYGGITLTEKELRAQVQIMEQRGIKPYSKF